jgi:rod shape-determining protein MreD
MATRNPASFWVFFAILIVTHFVLHLALGLGTSAPDFMVVALLLAARRVRGAVAALIGLGLGIINDALSASSFGADAVAMTLLGYLGARSRDLFDGDSLLFVGVYLFVGKWLHEVAYWLLAPAARGDALSQLVIHGPLAALYTAIGGAIALLIYRATTGER